MPVSSSEPFPGLESLATGELQQEIAAAGATAKAPQAGALIGRERQTQDRRWLTRWERRQTLHQQKRRHFGPLLHGTLHQIKPPATAAAASPLTLHPVCLRRQDRPSLPEQTSTSERHHDAAGLRQRHTATVVR
jgi:hypothetical protein